MAKDHCNIGGDIVAQRGAMCKASGVAQEDSGMCSERAMKLPIFDDPLGKIL